MMNDKSFQKCEVSGCFGDFDQLCYYLKCSWSVLLIKKEVEEEEEEEVQLLFRNIPSQLKWVLERFYYFKDNNNNDQEEEEDNCLREFGRLHMIDQVSQLFDTKSSLLNQLHRYLYLGVFNYKLTHQELTSRIQLLEKQVEQLSVFSSILWNKFSNNKQCVFEGTLCNSETAQLQTPLLMYEHYFYNHIGVTYALCSQELTLRLKQQQQQQQLNTKTRRTRKESDDQKQISFLDQDQVQLNSMLHFLHDYHVCDYKTKTKNYLKNQQRNFVLKGICVDCGVELHHYGQVYWQQPHDHDRNDEQEENQVVEQALQIGKKKKTTKPFLIFKHKQIVKDLLSMYDENFDSDHVWSELQILDKQWNQFKSRQLKQMRSEILINEQGKYSQCKSCFRKYKGHHPLLKGLKEEYFTLPFEKAITLEEEKEEEDQLLPYSSTDAKFMTIQKQILNRKMKESSNQGWSQFRTEIQNGYFKIDSYPKLVQIYGNISESLDQNPKRVLSQPILHGYMKVLFQFPLIYIPNTSIIYQMQPQWAKVRQQFQLFGSSNVQRSELISLLETHPIMQNHTYQMSNLTRLAIDQVDLLHKLNKHLFKQTNQMEKCKSKQQQQQQQEEELQSQQISNELTKTCDLLYFDGLIHRTQVTFLIQQFSIWEESFEIFKLQYYELIQQKLQQSSQEEQEEEEEQNEQQQQLYSIQLLLRAKVVMDEYISNISEIYTHHSQGDDQNDENNKKEEKKKKKKKKNFELMLIFTYYYLIVSTFSKQKDEQCEFLNFNLSEWSQQTEKEFKFDKLTIYDFFFSDHIQNPFRVLIYGTLLPILIPLVDQFVHPIYLGTLLQIFQLSMNNAHSNQLSEGLKKQSDQISQKLYKEFCFKWIATLTIKRCLPLFQFEKTTNHKAKEEEVISNKMNSSVQAHQDEEAQEEEEEDQFEYFRKKKLNLENRTFQCELFNQLSTNNTMKKKINKKNYTNEKIDMQCRYVLAKRALLKVMNSELLSPPIECDLRWAMQVSQIFYHSIRKTSRHGNDDSTRNAQTHLKELRELKEEIDYYFSKNKVTIPSDFLFKEYKTKTPTANTSNKMNDDDKEEQSKITCVSDLRQILQETLKEDLRTQNNQWQFTTGNANSENKQYQKIHNVKIAFFIPLEKKLNNIMQCIAKLRSLPHRQTYRSFEKFHKYQYREMEMLAFPELYVTGQGFQQHIAPKISQNYILMEINQQERDEGQNIIKNMKGYQIRQQKKYQFSEEVQQSQENLIAAAAAPAPPDNQFNFQVQLEDFTAQYRKGEPIPKPKTAILKLKDEEYLNSELSTAFLFKLQKISIIKVFQIATQTSGVEEQNFSLQQSIEIKLKDETVLSESFKDQHILKNFSTLIKKQRTWNNELQQFVGRVSEEIQKQKQQSKQQQFGQLNSEMLEYLRLQESMFLEKKRQELGEQFKQVDLSDLEYLRQQQPILDLNLTKIKKQKSTTKKQNSISNLEEEIHSEVIRSVQSNDEITKQIQQQLMTFSSSYIVEERIYF